MDLIIQIQLMFIIIYCEYFLYLNMGIELIKDKYNDQNRLISMKVSKLPIHMEMILDMMQFFYFFKFF